MATPKFALLLPLLLAAVPALAQQAGPPADQSEMVGGWPALSPQLPQVQAAFDALGSNPAFPRTYLIHAAKCMPIASVEGHRAVACRLDFTMTDTVPELRVTRYRDDCTRFTLQGADWRILQDRDSVPCEMPSVLKRDPAPLPDRAALEEELVANFQCHDGPAEDCFIYVEKVTLDSAVCTAIGVDSEGKLRIACRTSGTVGYTSHRRPQSFTDYCIRVSRFSVRGETPASWVLSWEDGDDEKPCEARARGTDILR